MVNLTIPVLLSCASYSGSRSNCCRRRSDGIWATSPSMRGHASLILEGQQARLVVYINEFSSRLVAICATAHRGREEDAVYGCPLARLGASRHGHIASRDNLQKPPKSSTSRSPE